MNNHTSKAYIQSNMSDIFYLNFVLSMNNEGYKYKKATKGDYDYDYDEDAETVVYDFEEDTEEDEDAETVVYDFEEVAEDEDAETVVYDFEEGNESKSCYSNFNESEIFNCVRYDKYMKTKEEQTINEILNEIGYISEENLKEITEECINEILKEIDASSEESSEERSEESEEISEESSYEDESEDEDDGINIIIEDCIWPPVQKAECSLTNHEVNQRGYNIMKDKSEMFKRMYKTKKCTKSKCKSHSCPFYHSKMDKRIGICAFERGCVNTKCTLVHL